MIQDYCELSDVLLTAAKVHPHVGVMMWEVLHGTPPYLLLPRNSRPVPHPAFPSFPRYCPLSFSGLATACLSPDPSSRPNFHQIYHVLDDLYKHLLAPSAESATLAAHVPLHALHTRAAERRAAAAAATVGAMHAASMLNGAVADSEAVDSHASGAVPPPDFISLL